MYRAFGMAVIASLTVACSSAGNILGPDTAAISLTADNLTGRWAEAARIYRKVGAQTGVLADTVGVSSADQAIYQFNLDGTGIVRRVQPNPGKPPTALIRRARSTGTSTGLKATGLALAKPG
jgi:hypothetical protein